MKKIFLILIIAGTAFLFAEEYQIIDANTKREIKLTQLAEQLISYDIIFFGEYHGNELLHRLEKDLLIEFHKLYQELIVSMEMFERDVQSVLNNYLAGEITEKEFLENSRPWGNYESDYKPLVEFAKNNELPVLAANIPRRYAGMISKKENALDSLSAEEKRWVAKEHKVLADEYKTKFIKTMKGNMAHGKAPKKMMMNFDLIYAAQCIKDDTMAESIQEALKKSPGKKVIHYNGDFHSRQHLGTAQKLQLLMPQKKIAVIAPVESENELDYSEDALNAGDYLIIFTN